MLTTKKEYHECTDTMAQMKNKINETKNIHTVCSVICGHDKSAPTVGVRGYTLHARGQISYVRGINIDCT